MGKCRWVRTIPLRCCKGENIVREVSCKFVQRKKRDGGKREKPIKK